MLSSLVANSPPLGAVLIDEQQIPAQGPQRYGSAVSLGVSGEIRRMVFDGWVEEVLKEMCLEIELRYEVKFLEIGADRDDARFLVQSVPTYSVTKLVLLIKSVTARKVFKMCPKKKLWGGEFWANGYFASTVGKHGDEKKIES